MDLRSKKSLEGRRMSGARALWRANGMKDSQMGQPIIAVVNSFTQFVPGHAHLHDIGQKIKARIEELGCYAAEFNTIAIDDGIAMGHDGMLYSLPSREIIADSVEYMCNAHCVDAIICISNCDKITPGMLMAAMRLNIPTVFVSGGPMEAGSFKGKGVDLIDAMVMGADASVDDNTLKELEMKACPTCGCCSGMFTANSMNCLCEALGMAPVGNGTILATHVLRQKLFIDAAELIVNNAKEYYFNDNSSVLPRSIATRDAFLNAMRLDIAMGGSTNTVLHLLAIAAEAEVEFTMKDIDKLSRNTPVLCKVAPSSNYHIQDVHRAGGIMAILAELRRKGLVNGSTYRVDYPTLDKAIDVNDIVSADITAEVRDKYYAAPCGTNNLKLGSSESRYVTLDHDRVKGCIRNAASAYSTDGGLAVLYGNIAIDGSIVKSAGVDKSALTFKGTAKVYNSQDAACDAILSGEIKAGDVVVITYEGPKGGPGMQEMLYPTSYLKSMHLGKECALITDGRFSGGTSGLSIGHVSPEAAAEGNIALIRTGDIIEIDIPHRRLELCVSDETLLSRRLKEEQKSTPFSPEGRERKISRSLKAYAAIVSSADKGAIREI